MKIKLSGKSNISTAICLYVCLSLLFLLYLIGSSTGKVVFDERFFFPNIKVLEQYGFSFAFLKNMKEQSPGPLYQYIYYPLKYIMPLTPKNLRYVNFLFLVGDLYFLHLLVRLDQNKNTFLIPLLIVGIPMTWGISGIAMTELPSLFFCLFSIWLFRRALNSGSKLPLILSAFAGLAMGTAIIGRSPFLMVLPAILLIYSLPGKGWHTSTFLAFSVIFPCVVFYAWQGLVPPDVQNIQSGINPMFLFFAVTYLVLATIVIYPSFFILPKTHYGVAAIIAVLSFLGNIIVCKISYSPMNGVLTSKLIPRVIQTIYPYLFLPMAIGITYIFATALFFHLMRNKQSFWKLFYLIISLLIIVTTVKSSAHFSSRYVMQAYPFFLLYVAGSIKVSKFLLLRVVVGTVIGIASLCACYAIYS